MAESSLNIESNRLPYTVKAYGAFLCLVLDAVLAATADFHDLPQIARWYPMILIGLQLLMQVMVFLCIFLLFAGTYVFQVGLISVLFREFRWVVRLALLYFVVFVVYAGIKASLLFGTSTPEELLWSDGGFAAVAIIARLVSLAYYASVVDAVLRLGRIAWYHRAPWVSGIRTASN